MWCAWNSHRLWCISNNAVILEISSLLPLPSNLCIPSANRFAWRLRFHNNLNHWFPVYCRKSGTIMMNEYGYIELWVFLMHGKPLTVCTNNAQMRWRGYPCILESETKDQDNHEKVKFLLLCGVLKILMDFDDISNNAVILETSSLWPLPSNLYSYHPPIDLRDGYNFITI